MQNEKQVQPAAAAARNCDCVEAASRFQASLQPRRRVDSCVKNAQSAPARGPVSKQLKPEVLLSKNNPIVRLRKHTPSNLTSRRDIISCDGSAIEVQAFAGPKHRLDLLPRIPCGEVPKVRFFAKEVLDFDSVPSISAREEASTAIPLHTVRVTRRQKCNRLYRRGLTQFVAPGSLHQQASSAVCKRSGAPSHFSSLYVQRCLSHVPLSGVRYNGSSLGTWSALSGCRLQTNKSQGSASSSAFYIAPIGSGG